MRNPKFLTLRLPGNVGAALAAAAKTSHVSVSGFARAAIVAALPESAALPPLPTSPPPRPSVVPAEDLAVIAALGGQIGRLTGSTIQLARTFREGGQRQGIDVVKCNPSPQIQAAWRREQDASAKSVRTISGVRSEMVDAQDLIAAAKGDRNAIVRLPGPLQAFAAIYLDDEQRRHLAAQSVADVIPHLERFRQTGAVELEAWERRTGRKFVPPKPENESRADENKMEMR
jgi:hypothetical protein